MIAARERTGAPLVLVVDDYPDGRAIVRDILAFGGFDVVEAASGPEALEQAAAERPDIVLMDLSLPGLDGTEVTRRMRRDPVLMRTPVIALTAHALDDDKQRALAAGCQRVIVKPCQPRDIVDGVREVLAAARTAAQTKDQEV